MDCHQLVFQGQAKFHSVILLATLGNGVIAIVYNYVTSLGIHCYSGTCWHRYQLHYGDHFSNLFCEDRSAAFAAHVWSYRRQWP